MKLRTRTIHFRAENTTSDNEKQLWAHQKPGTLLRRRRNFERVQMSECAGGAH